MLLRAYPDIKCRSEIMDFAAEPKRAEARILESMQAEDRKGAGRKPKLQPVVDIRIGS